MTKAEYLAAVRALTPTGSVYAAAQLLGMSEETVRSWNLYDRWPDAYACARIAETLDMPVEQVLADVNAEREKDPERKAYWTGLARKFAACVVMGGSIAIGATDEGSATGHQANKTENSEVTFVQIMRQLIRWLIFRSVINPENFLDRVRPTYPALER